MDDEEQIDYVRIEKWLLDVEDAIGCDLFEQVSNRDEYVLFLPQDHPIDKAIKKKIDHLEYHLYIKRSDLAIYEHFIDGIVQAVAKNTHIAITKKAAIIYRQASFVLDDMFHDPEALENVPKSKKVVNTFVDTILTDTHAIESLIKITAYDYYTHTHSINVCIYSLSLGSYIGLEVKVLEALGISALLHDLGKSKIDHAITNKNGRLNDDEYEQMKHHPLYGYKIALKIGIKDPLILDGIRHHHEKIDGSGYPDGISAKKITLFARIIGVCDVFDALSTKRSYKERLSSFDALKLIKETMSHHLDIKFVDAFIQMQRRENEIDALSS